MKSRFLWTLLLFVGMALPFAGGCHPSEHVDQDAPQLVPETKLPQRYGWVIGVKPKKLDYYKKLHANAWAGVNKQIRDSNIQNYSIYLTQFDNGKWYLFGYYEYVGDDFEADMKKMAENKEIIRWLKETDPCQIPFGNRQEGEWWKQMEEVYRLK